MKKPEFKATVEVSREWDGEKVAEELVKKLKAKTPNPKFILLFTTIHYEKEFKPILNGIKSAFPNSPLIGGTVAGFITPEGCFTRGVTCLAVDYPNMEVAIGVGHNTKRDPKKAVDDCIKIIKKNFKIKYSNKILFILTSAGIVPKIPGLGQKRVIKSEKISKTLLKSLSIFKRLQFGPGREDEIIQCMERKFYDFVIVGGSTVDDNRWEKNFQFFENYIYTNSIVACYINTDIKWSLDTTFGLYPTDVKMKITEKTLYDCIIKSIENKEPSKKFLEKVRWPEEFFDENLYRRTLYYPICFYYRKKLYPRVIGSILGNYIGCTNKIASNAVQIYSASGNSLINSVKVLLKKYNISKINFSLIISCTAILETLGDAVFRKYDLLKKFYKNTPFIVLYLSGEDARKPKEDTIRLNESFNIMNFYKN